MIETNYVLKTGGGYLYYNVGDLLLPDLADGQVHVVDTIEEAVKFTKLYLARNSFARKKYMREEKSVEIQAITRTLTSWTESEDTP